MAICCPKTFTGFCLDDQTPIAITIDNGVLISWTNLVTGVVTPGNPPAGTGVCEVPSTITVEVEIPPVTFDPLTCAKDSVTICPGDDPIEVFGTVTVNQGTSPWVVSATDFDIRNLACGQDSVDACVTYDYAEDSLHVSGDQGAFVLAVRNDAGAPLAADGDYIPFTTDATGALRVNATFNGAITVALDCATDSVTVCPGDDPISVTVLNFPAPSPLTCEIDSITVCPPVSGVFDVNIVSPTGGATEATLLDVKRSVTDFRTLLDYDIRLDGNPVYVGKNLQTALTSAATWVIQKLFYDLSNRLIDAQVLTGSWDGRAALAWKPAGGN